MYIHYNRRTYLGFFLNVKLCKIQDFVYNVMCTKQVNIQDKNTEIQEQKRYQNKQKFMQNAIGSHWYSDFLLRSDILWGFFFVCFVCTVFTSICWPTMNLTPLYTKMFIFFIWDSYTSGVRSIQVFVLAILCLESCHSLTSADILPPL